MPFSSTVIHLPFLSDWDLDYGCLRVDMIQWRDIITK